MIRLKGVKLGIYGAGALVVIVLATVLRILLIAQNFPYTNSDEGTVGLMALHIAYRGEHPVFFYGQGYMGPFEAYVGAGLFFIFGPSLFSLRLGLALVFACFLGSMYMLTSLLYTKRWALISLMLLSLGTSGMLTRQLTALGGYTETLLFGALIFLVALQLALSFRPGIALSTARRRRRMLCYGGWGMLVGLGLWNDTLVVPFVLIAGVLLIRFCRAELQWRGGSRKYILMGLGIGLLPVIIYNIVVPLRTVVDLWNVHHTANANIPLALPLPLQAVLGTVLISLPIATGQHPLCMLVDLPPFGSGGSHTGQCIALHGGWGAGYVLLLTLAGMMAIQDFRRCWRQYQSAEHAAHEERETAIRYFAHLMLASSAMLTLVLYTISPVAAQTPVGSARYLVGLLICVPTVFWPLWGYRYASHLFQHRFLRAILMLFRWAVLLLIALSLLWGTVDTFTRETITARAINEQQADLIAHLSGMRARHIYSEYGTCNWLIFMTREQLICSVLDTSLRTGVNRYPLYETIVQSDAHAVYIFPVGSMQARTFAWRVATSEKRYRRFEFDGYVVYQPIEG